MMFMTHTHIIFILTCQNVYCIAIDESRPFPLALVFSQAAGPKAAPARQGSQEILVKIESYRQ